jgi:transposase
VLLPAAARSISAVSAIQEDEHGGVVFVYGWATGCWGAGEDPARRLAALQLVRLGLATRREVAAGFGTDPATLWRWDKAYQSEGLTGLLRKRPGPKGPSKLTAQRAMEIRELAEQGLGQRQVAERVQLSRATVHRVLGQLPAVPAPANSQLPSELSVFPPPEPRQEEPEMARTGALDEAELVFNQGRKLSLLGLLLALPAVAETGLLEAGQTVYGKLRSGCYGLRSFLLMLVFLTLLREPRAEGATRIVPPDLCRVLALDQAPEVKTICRRLRELADRGLGSEFIMALAQHHAKARSQAAGILYVDGHVRVYSGRHRLPKAHITHLRTAGPAREENGVSDADGEPLLVVMQPPGRSIVSELKALLPQLRELVGERRVTICFDRGGWSPGLFWELQQAGYDFFTYRKGRTRKEPTSSFVRVCHREARKEYELTDHQVRFKLRKGKGRPRTFLVRQVTRRDDAHQVRILTSRQELEVVEVAYRMFSRWQQENYFRDGRSHSALDDLDFYQVEDDGPERSVPNPVRARLRRKLLRARHQLTEAEAAQGKAAQSNQESQRPTIRGFKIANADLGQQLLAARQAVQELEAELANTPARLSLGEVTSGTQLLDAESKLVTHGVRMSAFNGESALARLLVPCYRRAEDEGRALLREAFRTSGSLEIVGDRLEVGLDPLSAPRHTRALAALCNQLNQTETSYPGTDLVLRYSVNQPTEVT